MSMWAKGMEKKTVTASVSPLKKAVDERLSAVKIASGSKEAMFNSDGELNAGSRKEALAVAERFASVRDKVFAASMGDAVEKYRGVQSQLSDLIGDSAYKQRFASDMIPLILERLDYQGFGRQMLKTHSVQQGQIIDYDMDINTLALVVADDGATITQQIKGDRLFVPEFTVSANPHITIQEVLTRQYDIVDRLLEKTKYQIQLTEDRNLVRQLYQAGQIYNTPVEVTGTIDKGVFESMVKTIEEHRLIADKFVMHRSDYSDLRTNMNAMDFDPVTSREMLMSGIMSSLYGVNILVSSGKDEPGKVNVSVPKGLFFATTEGRYSGAMPIRQDLTMANADQFVNGKAELGWLYYEVIGQIITNPRAVAVGWKSGASIPAWVTN